MEDLTAFARLVDAIRPWTQHLVFVGGWAHRLHRFHPLASPPGYMPLRTRDSDLAFPTDAALQGNIGAALEDAGFIEEFLGDHNPPASHYRLGGDDAGFYAEFLAPLQGGSVKRGGRPDATISKAGITAQKLRHLDVLLIDPWVARAGTDFDMPLASPAALLVANPVTFIIQKLLIQDVRKPHKQAQDVLYIHDSLELFGPSLSELNVMWEKQIAPQLQAKTIRRIRAAAGAMFGRVSDVTRNAARIPRDRHLSAERLRAASALALEELLADAPDAAGA